MTSDDKATETPQEKIARLSNALGLDKIIQRQEEQAKMLDGVIHELGNTNQNMSNLKSWLESLINQTVQPTTVTGTATMSPQNNMPVGVSAMMGDPLAKVEMIKQVAEIVQMFRGGQPKAPSTGINMQDMLMEWFGRVMQASLDGMASQVYGVQFKPPKNIVNSTVRLGNVGEGHGVE